MARSIDFNIRAALLQNQSALEDAQQKGKTALTAYNLLQPTYETAVGKAKKYQSTLTKNYDAYQTARNEAVAAYDTEVASLKSAYDAAVAALPGLQQTLEQATTKRSPLGKALADTATEGSRLYGLYEDAYQTALDTSKSDYKTSLATAQTTYEDALAAAQSAQTDYNTLVDESTQRNYYFSENTRDVAASMLSKILSIEEGASVPKVELEVLYGPRPGQKTTDYLTSKKQANVGTLTELLKRRAEAYQQYVTDEKYTDIGGSFDYYKRKADEATADYNTTVADIQSQLDALLTAATTSANTYETSLAAYDALAAETPDYAAYAESASASELEAYKSYLPTVQAAEKALDAFDTATYNPAVAAYTAGQEAISTAKTAYDALAANSTVVDEAASDARQVYDASLAQYESLQAAYQGLEPQLSEYSQQISSAADTAQLLTNRAPGLQRSLAIDMAARKRGTRQSYGRSILTRGFKRAGAAR